MQDGENNGDWRRWEVREFNYKQENNIIKGTRLMKLVAAVVFCFRHRGQTFGKNMSLRMIKVEG
jgi:hypothetical protein